MRTRYTAAMRMLIPAAPPGRTVRQQLRRLGWLVAAALLIPPAGCGSSGNGGAGPSPVVTPGTMMCSSASDSCAGRYSTLFAISHSFNAPENTVLMRVTVPAWTPGTDWGDGHNGFFYQATVSGQTEAEFTYVPFNAMGSTGGKPQLPQFSFIVPVDVSAGAAATSIAIAACSSDYQFDGADPACTTQYWIDTYSPLPAPVVGDPPFSVATLEFSGTQTTAIPNNGVSPGLLTIGPEEDLTDDQTQWLYDHMVFFDLNGDPYTNDIFDDSSQDHRSIGVLTIDEAAFANPPGGSTYYTKYGSTAAITAAGPPQKQFFFYSKDDQATTTIDVGAQFIYDRSASCPGWINDVGSQASSCESDAPLPPGSLPDIAPYAEVTPQTDESGNVSATTNGVEAGTQEQRTISFFASNQSAPCAHATNPLAVDAKSAYSPPNYIIDDVTAGVWGTTFPNGLYYLVPTGFGNCVESAANMNATPFCHRAASYAAYVPHYADENGVFATLNGGSTTAALVGSAVLADQYAIPALFGSAENSLVWFDNCGYGYIYEETDLSERLSVPNESDFPTLTYSVANHFAFPVTYSKECCASAYVENTDSSGQCRQDVTPCPLIPQQQIDDSYGLFVAGSGSIAYQTNFNDEALVVYDATSGAQLFKLRVNEAQGALYACTDTSAAAELAGSDNDFSVDIGASGAGSLTCAAVGSCPFGATASVDGLTTTCTVEHSSFLLAVPEWAEQIASYVDRVQLVAWGAKGHEGKAAAGSGGDPGGGGFALTVLTPADLTDNLYTYIGRFSSSYGSGGSSTVLTSTPLSSLISPSSADPEASGVLLIAGSGGGGGEAGVGNGGNGGNGGTAIANANPPNGIPANAAGEDGHKGGSTQDVGHGGNQGGDGVGGSEGGHNGLGGRGGNGDGDDPVHWDDGGSLIPPSSYDAGEGGTNSTAGGGGGYGGGGRAQTDADPSPGCGGGGSWALANSIYDSSAPSSATSSPAGGDGAVQIVYTVTTGADCQTDSGIGIACSLSAQAGDDSIDLTSVLAQANALDAAVSVTPPMWIQAWGADGLRSSGSPSGAGGYAQTVTTLDDYQSAYGTTTLYYYVGALGLYGGESGGGGASTIAASAASSFSADNVLLVAGGGGGEGGKSGDHLNGGAGGTAIAGQTSCGAGTSCPNGDTPTACAASSGVGCCAGGASGSVTSGSGAAGGGDAGAGGAAGNAGDSLDSSDNAPSAGGTCFGGRGGSKGTTGGSTGLAGWVNVNTTITTEGTGGNGGLDTSNNNKEGGGGGGGFGGGGGGWAGSSGSYGGGGGGSYAVLATMDDGTAPSSDPGKPSAAGSNGFVRITFNP